MNLITISDISNSFNISTRTLRYYEQIGLLKSTKKDDYAYRTYDDEAVLKLQQIIVLRKLRIPLKQIKVILESENTAEIITAFQQNLWEIEDEITSLATIKEIITKLLAKLNLENDGLRLLDDESLLEIVDSLTVTKINFKEDKTMADLNKANEKLNKLTDVRIIYLPPMTIASASGVGYDSEGQASEIINRFVLENNLLAIKPDIRHFGFDCSAGQTGVGEPSHKYQMWVSIPEEMAVPAPLVKRKFSGGLYAAHMIKMGDFDHWVLLRNWVLNNNKYEHDWDSIRCEPYEDDMDRCFEEQLNYLGNVQNSDFDGKNTQLDLLFPIKEKQ